jgi:putative hydrolase of the HAD superfamily
VTRAPKVTSDTVIAWDFDGVLNRNIVDGRFIWADRFAEDIGHAPDGFIAAVFDATYDRVMTGQEDLRDRIAKWCAAHPDAPGPDAMLDYWFTHDAHPDLDMIRHLKALTARGHTQIIATNNEPHRARFITDQMGFGAHVAHIFASGHMGLRKPDPAFFRHITDALKTDPAHMLLIDDTPENIDAAQACGWQGYTFNDATRVRLFRALGLS